MSDPSEDRSQPQAMICDVVREVVYKEQPQTSRNQDVDSGSSGEEDNSSVDDGEEEVIHQDKRFKVEFDSNDKTLRKDRAGKIIETDWWVGTDYATREERSKVGKQRPEVETLDPEEVAQRKERIEEIAGKEAVAEATNGMLDSTRTTREMNQFVREKRKGELRTCTTYLANNTDKIIADSNVGDFRTAGQLNYFNLTTRSQATRGLSEDKRVPRPKPQDFLPRITTGSNRIGCYVKIGPWSEERGENTLMDIQSKREEHKLSSDVYEIDANDKVAIDFVFRKIAKEMGEKSYSISMREKDGKVVILVEYYGSTIAEDGFRGRAVSHENVSASKQGVADIAFHGDPEGEQDLAQHDPPIPQTFTGEFFSLAEPIRTASKGRMFVLENALAVNAGAILSPDWLEFQRWRGGKIDVLRPDENLRANRAFPIAFSRTDPANDREPLSTTRHIFSCGLSMHLTKTQLTIRPPQFDRSFVPSELAIPEQLRSQAFQTGGDRSRSFSLRVVKEGGVWTSKLGIKERFGPKDESSLIRSLETSEIDNHPKFVEHELRIAACRAAVYIRNQGDKGETLLAKVGFTAEELDNMEWELLQHEADQQKDPKSFGEQRFLVQTMAAEDKIPLRWMPPPEGQLNPAPCLSILRTKKNQDFAGKVRLNLGGDSLTKLRPLVGSSGKIDKSSFPWPFAQYTKLYDDNGVYTNKQKWRISFEDHPSVVLLLNANHFPSQTQRDDFSNKAKKLLADSKTE